MTTIHFIRHGEVENPDNIFYGRLPGFPLSVDGVSCIEYMGEQLCHYPITTIYHSPMLRTQQTAELLAKHLHRPTLVDDRLIEIATLFEGKPRGLQSRVTHYPVAKSGYAETMGEIYERMAEFVRFVADKHKDEQIVAVSHGGPIRILELGIEGKPFTDEIYEQAEVPLCGADTMIIIEGQNFSVKTNA